MRRGVSSMFYRSRVILQLKFSVDPIDETDSLEGTLKPRVESFGGTLEKVQLSGNHITPCAQVMSDISKAIP